MAHPVRPVPKVRQGQSGPLESPASLALPALRVHKGQAVHPAPHARPDTCPHPCGSTFDPQKPNHPF